MDLALNLILEHTFFFAIGNLRFKRSLFFSENNFFKEYQERSCERMTVYKEEMFARFVPYKFVGVWEGKNASELMPE